MRDMALAAEAGADFVELRIDTFDDPVAVSSLCHDAVVSACIVTRRPSSEGGDSDEPDQQRLRVLFESAGDFADYVDVELRASKHVPALWITEPHENQPRIIISSHDFSGRPVKLM